MWHSHLRIPCRSTSQRNWLTQPYTVGRFLALTPSLIQLMRILYHHHPLSLHHQCSLHPPVTLYPRIRLLKTSSVLFQSMLQTACSTRNHQSTLSDTKGSLSSGMIHSHQFTLDTTLFEEHLLMDFINGTYYWTLLLDSFIPYTFKSHSHYLKEKSDSTLSRHDPRFECSTWRRLGLVLIQKKSAVSDLWTDRRNYQMRIYLAITLHVFYAQTAYLYCKDICHCCRDPT